MSAPLVVHDPATLAAALAGHRAGGGTVALVPTMGALHDGHLRLVDVAAEHAGGVVVSVFVNPTQFDDAADLAAYPADLAADLAALATTTAARTEGPLIVHAPTVATMYPRGTAGLTRVHVPVLTDHLCGPHRPGHFDGVATVVVKLLAQVRPDVAVFGRKDFQQLAVVRRAARDLDLGVEVVGVPTVREPDGLARSSRNARLDALARDRATAVPRALTAGVRAARAGSSAGEVRRAARAVIDADAALVVDYVEVVDVDDLAPVAEATTPTEDRPLLLAVALHVPSGSSTVRLIDSVVVGDRDDEDRLLRAVGAP